MTRQFGLRNMSRRTIPSGALGNSPAAYGAQRNTGADLYPIPSNSLRAAPVDDRVRERAAITFCTIVLSLSFLIPMVLAGIMLHFK